MTLASNNSEIVAKCPQNHDIATSVIKYHSHTPETFYTRFFIGVGEAFMCGKMRVNKVP